MFFPSRFRPSARALGAAAAVGAAATVLAGTAGIATIPAQAAVFTASTVRTPAVASVQPGLTGPAITVANHVELAGAEPQGNSSYDLATGPDGTSYLAWLFNTKSGRDVGFCKLPRGAKGCAGGVKTMLAGPSAGDSSDAQGLHVLVDQDNLVTLVWEHSVIGGTGGESGEIAVASSDHGDALTGSSDESPAPSNGILLDAVRSPDGEIWTASLVKAGSGAIQVTRGLGSAFQTVKSPVSPGQGILAFSGFNGVLAVDKAGSVTKPVYYARQSGNGWTGFKTVPKTWSTLGFGMAGTTSGVRVIASENNAGYHPVVSSLTSSGFSTPTLTGDKNNCAPSNHDTVADASGRLADVTEECQAVTVSNLANTRHAAIFRFSIPKAATFAGGNAQLTTAPSGHGWVAWSTESGTTDKLQVAPLLLPGLDVTVALKGTPGKASVTGPTACLPPVNIGVGVAAKANSGWKVLGKSLKVNGVGIGSPLKGAGLTQGKAYALTGTITFGRGSARATEKATLNFHSCPKP